MVGSSYWRTQEAAPRNTDEMRTVHTAPPCTPAPALCTSIVGPGYYVRWPIRGAARTRAARCVGTDDVTAVQVTPWLTHQLYVTRTGNKAEYAHAITGEVCHVVPDGVRWTDVAKQQLCYFTPRARTRSTCAEAGPVRVGLSQAIIEALHYVRTQNMATGRNRILRARCGVQKSRKGSERPMYAQAKSYFSKRGPFCPARAIKQPKRQQ